MQAQSRRRAPATTRHHITRCHTLLWHLCCQPRPCVLVRNPLSVDFVAAMPWSHVWVLAKGKFAGQRLLTVDWLDCGQYAADRPFARYDSWKLEIPSREIKPDWDNSCSRRAPDRGRLVYTAERPASEDQYTACGGQLLWGRVHKVHNSGERAIFRQGSSMPVSGRRAERSSPKLIARLDQASRLEPCCDLNSNACTVVRHEEIDETRGIDVLCGAAPRH